MIQITPQMRILLALEPADFRKYAEPAVMWSRRFPAAENPLRKGARLRIGSA